MTLYPVIPLLAGDALRGRRKVHLDAETDYRLRVLERAEIYHCPLDTNADLGLSRSFESSWDAPTSAAVSAHYGPVSARTGKTAAAIPDSRTSRSRVVMSWMVGGWAGATRFGLEDAAWLPSSPHVWLLAWLIISVIGLAIQWTIRPRRADKPA